MKLSDRTSNWSSKAVGALSGLIWGSVMFAFLAFTLPQQAVWAAAIGAAIGAVLFGVWFGYYVARERTRMGGVGVAVAVDEAVKTGSLPPGPLGPEWHAALRHRKRQAQQGRWQGPLLFGGVAALGIGLILDGELVPWFIWPCVAFSLILVIAYPIWLHRQLSRIARIETQLRSASAPTDSSEA